MTQETDQISLFYVYVCVCVHIYVHTHTHTRYIHIQRCQSVMFSNTEAMIMVSTNSLMNATSAYYAVNKSPLHKK